MESQKFIYTPTYQDEPARKPRIHILNTNGSTGIFEKINRQSLAESTIRHPPLIPHKILQVKMIQESQSAGNFLE